MIYLLLSICCSVSIPVIFKLFEKYKIQLIYPILINYLVASMAGFGLTGFNSQIVEKSGVENWYLIAIITGILLIIMFFLIGYATQKIGIASTTLSNKLSVVIPICFSLIYDINDKLIPAKFLLIFLALIALILSIYKPHQEKTKFGFWLPFLLFAGLGIIDSLIKYAQTEYITLPDESAVFSALSFTTAGIAGFMFLFFKGENVFDILQVKYIIGGIALGLVNFGSMYFFINALNTFPTNSSLLFGANNIGIVLISVGIARIAYNENLSKINITGILLAIVSIALIFIVLK